MHAPSGEAASQARTWGDPDPPCMVARIAEPRNHGAHVPRTASLAPRTRLADRALVIEARERVVSSRDQCTVPTWAARAFPGCSTAARAPGGPSRRGPSV